MGVGVVCLHHHGIDCMGCWLVLGSCWCGVQVEDEVEGLVI